MIRICFGICSTVLLVGMAGCSSRPPAYPVQGRVTTKDGTPVKHAVVEFRAKQGGQLARGSVDEEGRFQLTTYRANDGAVAGQHQVVVVQMILGTIGGPPIQHLHDHGPLIDPKYNNYESSGLTALVEAKKENPVALVVERRSDEHADEHAEDSTAH